MSLTIECDEWLPGVRVESTAKTTARTGVEMEAIVAVSVTLITIWDMVEGVDNALKIGEILLTEKRGGRSGDWVRD